MSAFDPLRTLAAVRKRREMSAPSVHEFIRQLEADKAHYDLASVREGAIMVQVYLPGERWEVEFFEDGEVDVEIYRSDGNMFGAEKLPELHEKARE